MVEVAADQADVRLLGFYAASDRQGDAVETSDLLQRRHTFPKGGHNRIHRDGTNRILSVPNEGRRLLAEVDPDHAARVRDVRGRAAGPSVSHPEHDGVRAA